MGFSDPWYGYIDIISLYKVNKFQGMNPMGLITPWDDSLEVIAFQNLKKCWV